jgi:hypothetical protein
LERVAWSEEQLAWVLNWVNSVRKDLGKKPLTALRKGRRGSFHCCPLGASIGGVGVSVKGVYRVKKSRANKFGEPQPGTMYRISQIPEPIAWFIHDFDELRIPQLVKK